ncbi:MAG TPA: nucleotide exchange factor GrpE [Thermoanaerobaculia bacterium]|nr:nucleotide exchange factor GrpE [Thermoanaerobaculia bacterium]
MSDRKEPDDVSGDEDIYVIDDSGDLDEVQELAGYREAPVPVGEEDSSSPPAGSGRGAGGGAESVRAESEKLRDQLLRTRADLENYRKRAERERSEFRRYALADTLRELLPVLDNLERALAVEGGAADDFRTGVEMIQRQLADVLARAGLSSNDPAGQPFDPSYHEAIAREETDEVEPNRVIDVLQKGYLLHDRLLRPALVKVSAAPRSGETEGGEPS